jgi:hypothetical protein
VVIAWPSSWPERQVVDVPGTFRGSVGSGHQPEAGDHPIVSRHDPGHAARGHRPPVFTAAQQPLTSVGMAQAPRVTDTFSCTGGEQSWTVPAGVDQATFVVEGAAGGALGDVPPGLGGRAEATVAVTAGTVYTIVVGRQGQRPGGYWPGVKPAQGGFGFGRGGDGGPSDSISSLGASAGGGGSAVLLGTEVMLVGGGGGGTAFGGDPGAGGGTTGGAGGPITDIGGGGGGGTATGPGAGGQVRAGSHGNAGAGHDGGSGSAAAGADNGGGGGGGGGWFGGGGGGSGDLATGGGGGGSGYAAPDLSAELTPGVRGGDGQVTVTHDATRSVQERRRGVGSGRTGL